MVIAGVQFLGYTLLRYDPLFYISTERLLKFYQIMPLTVRAKGVSLSTATNWAFNYIVGELTPVLQDVIEWRLYLMHGMFCVISFFLGESDFITLQFHRSHITRISLIP